MSRAARRPSPTPERLSQRAQRLGMLVLTAVLWSAAATLLAHQHRHGALAWTLSLVLNLAGDPLALVVARRVWYGSPSTPWLRLPLAAVAGVSASITLFVGLDAAVPTDGVLATVVLVVLGSALAAREPRRSRTERLATTLAGLS